MVLRYGLAIGDEGAKDLKSSLTFGIWEGMTIVPIVELQHVNTKSYNIDR